MTVRMLINASAHQEELRIAVVEDGELVELDIEAAESSTLKGNIYKGVVHNVEGSLEAAFVNIGIQKQGFLPFSEVAPAQYNRKWDDEKSPRITDVMRRGQEVIVQVAKDAVGEKGVTLTTYLSLPGRYTVLMPNSDAGGISRKIDDEKVRKKVRTMAQKIKKPDNCGFIVRTAGLGQTRLAVQKDLDRVVAQYEKMLKAAEIARAPSLLHSEPDLIARTLRDYFTEEIDEVWIDDKREYETAVAYFREVMPDYEERLHHYQNPIPIFAYHHVEEQIEATFGRQVSLPSGGSIVIDQTEALVAVDVNSGRMTSEGNHEETVFKTNCEAAEEVARQLKLRDLGGIVVVDFIDMEESAHKREVEKVLSEASKEDKARYKIARINSKGLCILTRQRIRQGMRKAFQIRCPVCTGTGWLRTPESHSLSLIRRIETRLAQGGVGEVRVKTHRSTAEYLLNRRREDLLRLERQYGARVMVYARPEMDRSQDEVSYHSHGELLAEITDRLPPREERRSRKKRKRSRSKKKKLGTDAATAAAELEGDDQNGEPESASAGSSSSSSSSKKKKKKRSKSRSSSTPGAAPADEKEPDKAAAADAEPARPQLEAKGGTTFTGKPSPELLEKMKAERKARMARRRAGSPDDSPDDGSDSGKAAPKPAPEAPAAAASADDSADRRSLLDRIFGTR
ncbi:MAG TPA: Rne/Rng family ribonuclease [Myxococcales bacterium LLY-WYZ-16_1]|nr:Rne/Rng family ribonuclease [Myxococcales bacterium LLY-WYZ-16_1]